MSEIDDPLKLGKALAEANDEIERLKKMCVDLGQSAMELGQQLKKKEAEIERLHAERAELLAAAHAFRKAWKFGAINHALADQIDAAIDKAEGGK
jgi:peptidoglycan hydrolase CwlO-like protein